MSDQRKVLKFAALAAALMALVVFSGAVNAFAGSAREFAGFYRATQVTKQDGKVSVHLALQVMNYTGTDVTNATIFLKSSLPHPPGDNPRDPEAAWEKQQPRFTGVTLHFNEHKVIAPLEGNFTVPAREFEQWAKGARPNFVIEFQDAAGNQRHEAIELTARP
jgi:hypothetical protein